MADGAWLDPNINAWWLDRSSPNDAAASVAYGRGMQMAQQKLESMQQARREETATKFKMLDFALESQRNQIALQTFRVKQDTDILRSQGMAEIGDYLSGAVKNGKLNDPETQAGFFSLTSKYAPFINEQTVNSMWDNTFGNAIRRDDAAKRIRSGGTDAAAFIQYDERIKQKEDELKAISDPSSPSYNPDLIEEKQREIERFRIGTGLVTAEESKQMKLAEFRAGVSEDRAKERMAFEKEMATGRAKTSKELQEERTKMAAGRDKLRNDIKSINDKYGLQIISATGNKEKQDKLIADRDKEIEDLWTKYNATFESDGATGGATSTQTISPDKVYDFDPTTYKVIK